MAQMCLRVCLLGPTTDPAFLADLRTRQAMGPQVASPPGDKQPSTTNRPGINRAPCDGCGYSRCSEDVLVAAADYSCNWEHTEEGGERGEGGDCSWDAAAPRFRPAPLILCYLNILLGKYKDRK